MDARRIFRKKPAQIRIEMQGPRKIACNRGQTKKAEETEPGMARRPRRQEATGRAVVVGTGGAQDWTAA